MTLDIQKMRQELGLDTITDAIKQISEANAIAAAEKAAAERKVKEEADKKAEAERKALEAKKQAEARAQLLKDDPEEAARRQAKEDAKAIPTQPKQPTVTSEASSSVHAPKDDEKKKNVNLRFKML